MTQNISPGLKQQYESLRNLIQRSLVLTSQYPDNEASVILNHRLEHLQSAALVVILGEVKSGKSSFVNALLNEEVCEVAPDPCTAIIQELVYGEERKKITLGDKWEKVYLPKPVLRDLSIVDTPGTNSIIQNHQTITENYFPKSDLVIFVLEATNPHRGTEWEFLSLIRKDWHRKIVFVLQMADRASKRELSINQERVKQYARERNVQDPIIFIVSAKREIEGASDSGFAEFREFLRKAVESGDVWRMKIEGTRDTVRKIATDLLTKLRNEEASFAADNAFYHGLLSTMEEHREKANSLRRLIVDSLCVSYDRLSSRLEENFIEGFSIINILQRSITFKKDKDIKSWLKELQSQFEKTAKEEINEESRRVSKDLSNEIKTMFNDLTSAIAHRQEAKSGGNLLLSSDRDEILERLLSNLNNIHFSDIVSKKGLEGEDLGSFTIAGGGIAVLGTIIAVIFHNMMFDITGGILTAIGLSLVAFTLLFRRPKILREFSRKLEKSRSELRDRFDQEIIQIFNRLFLEIDHQLKESIKRLEQQTAKISPLSEEAECIIKATQQI